MKGSRMGNRQEMTAQEAPSTLTLTVAARPENLALCRLALAGLARTWSIDQELLADLKLAVTESCSNAIRHAYDDGDGSVRLRLEIDASHVSIEVEDDGCGFQPPPDAAELDRFRDDGMGIALIRALTDELDLSAGPEGRGSLVRFRKAV